MCSLAEAVRDEARALIQSAREQQSRCSLEMVAGARAGSSPVAWLREVLCLAGRAADARLAVDGVVHACAAVAGGQVSERTRGKAPDGVVLRGRAGAAVEAAAALLEPAAHDAEEAQGLAKATTPLAPGGRFKAEMCGAVFRAYAAAVEAGSAAA